MTSTGWLAHFRDAQPVSFSLLVIAAVIALGLAMGQIRVRGIGLGVAGVLFSGLLFGHFHLTPEAVVMDFLRELGLTLFVFTIGLQVGPNFVASLRARGRTHNALAAGIVALGAVVTVLVSRVLGIDPAASLGVFSGATTNTPSLGAAQEALRAMGNAAQVELPAVGYAATYPLGIVGIILSMLAVKMVFRIDPAQEAAKSAAEDAPKDPLTRLHVVVENANLDGKTVSTIPEMGQLGVVVSRRKDARTGAVDVVKPTTTIHRGDTLLAVGAESRLEQFRIIVGRRSEEDLTSAQGPIVSERILVSKDDIDDRTLEELGLRERHGVAVTRVRRGDVELSARPGLALHMGDLVQVVGDRDGVTKVADALGNSLKALGRTNYLPMFVGLAVGVVVGSIPITMPLAPAPLKLGLAGGPLLVAIVLARIGRLGPLLWYMPGSTNFALRELGIVFFLSCVGMKAGEHFVEVLVGGQGARLVLGGCLVTFVPLLVAAAVGRGVLSMRFADLCGVLSGSMTDPPALAFATAMNGSDAAAVAYASVYPLTMLLRILVAQVLALWLC